MCKAKVKNMLKITNQYFNHHRKIKAIKMNDNYVTTVYYLINYLSCFDLRFFSQTSSTN